MSYRDKPSVEDFGAARCMEWSIKITKRPQWIDGTLQGECDIVGDREKDERRWASVRVVVRVAWSDTFPVLSKKATTISLHLIGSHDDTEKASAKFPKNSR